MDAVPVSVPPAAAPLPAPAAAGRLHYLDVARALLLLLGIPYHAAQAYSARAWFIHSESYSRVAELAGTFSHQFRMHAFFLVAGFFAALILGKRARLTWLRDRAARLLIPFLTMLLLVLPVQAMILGYLDGGDAAAGLARMLVEPRLWVAHSWFLRDLFLFCALLAVLWRPMTSLRWDAGRWTLLAAVPAALILWKLIVNLSVGSLLPRADPALIYDMATFSTYLPFFALGAVIGIAGMLPAVTRYSGWGVAAALGWLTLSALFVRRDDFGLGANALLIPLNGLIGSWALIAVARRFLDRPSAVIDYFVGGALIFYILHFGFVFVFTAWLRGSGLPPTIAWLLVTALTLAGCAAAYELIRRTPLLYFLFNGQARRT